MSQKRKRDEEEEDKTYEPTNNDEETFDEDSEEEEGSSEIQEETSESDDDIHDAQSFLKDAKATPKKKISKQNPPPLKIRLKKKKSGNDDEERNMNMNDGKGKRQKLFKSVPSTSSDADKEKDGSKKKSSAVMFNDNNIDMNLHNEAPQNIKQKKIKLSGSLIIMCHVIDGLQSKLPFNNDYPALTFQKKMKDGKAFQFSIPFNLAPTLQKAIQHMIDANPQFFSGMKKLRITQEEGHA